MKDADCIYGAVANKKTLFSSKCHTAMFFILLYL